MFEVTAEKNSRFTGRTKILTVRVPLADCATINAIANKGDSNVSDFIKAAISEKISRDLHGGLGGKIYANAGAV